MTMMINMTDMINMDWITWISENLGTIVVSVLLIVMIAGVVRGMIRNKKAGKSTCGCGCGCGSCPMGGSCHK